MTAANARPGYFIGGMTEWPKIEAEDREWGGACG